MFRKTSVAVNLHTSSISQPFTDISLLGNVHFMRVRYGTVHLTGVSLDKKFHRSVVYKHEHCDAYYFGEKF